jgi:hypothetical protein
MKITKQRLKEIIKEEVDAAISEQRPPLPPPPPPRKPTKRPPPPPPKAQANAGDKAFERFTNMLLRVINRGLGPEYTEREKLEAMIYFLNEGGANIPRGGRNPEKAIIDFSIAADDEELLNITRRAFAKAAKGIKAYKQQMRKT